MSDLLKKSEMKTWEARISTGDTTDGQVGLAFSVFLDSVEAPSEDAVLAVAKEAFAQCDQMELDATQLAKHIVLYTNSANMVVEDITSVDESDE